MQHSEERERESITEVTGREHTGAFSAFFFFRFHRVRHLLSEAGKRPRDVAPKKTRVVERGDEERGLSFLLLFAVKCKWVRTTEVGGGGVVRGLARSSSSSSSFSFFPFCCFHYFLHSSDLGVRGGRKGGGVGIFGVVEQDGEREDGGVLLLLNVLYCLIRLLCFFC